MNNKIDKIIYLMALQTFLEKNNCLHNKNKQKKLFPPNWNSINNYKLKAEIINEALNNNTKIEETKLFINNIK